MRWPKLKMPWHWYAWAIIAGFYEVVFLDMMSVILFKHSI